MWNFFFRASTHNLCSLYDARPGHHHRAGLELLTLRAFTYARERVKISLTQNSSSPHRTNMKKPPSLQFCCLILFLFSFKNFVFRLFLLLASTQQTENNPMKGKVREKKTPSGLVQTFDLRVVYAETNSRLIGALCVEFQFQFLGAIFFPLLFFSFLSCTAAGWECLEHGGAMLQCWVRCSFSHFTCFDGSPPSKPWRSMSIKGGRWESQTLEHDTRWNERERCDTMRWGAVH